MIPKRYEFLLFALLMSSFMTFIMSGVVSYINMGLVDNFLKIWSVAYVNAFIVAFPSVMVVVPMVRKLVTKIIKQS